MHKPGVGPQLCHFTWAKIAPVGTWGADGYQGRQCSQGAGELKSTQPLVADLLALGRRPRSRAKQATENLLGCVVFRNLASLNLSFIS